LTPKFDTKICSADFEVRINDNTKELEVLSCPNKQEPLDQQRSDKGHILVHFESETCSQCPLQDRCPVKIGVKVSTLTISEEQYAKIEQFCCRLYLLITNI